MRFPSLLTLPTSLLDGSRARPGTHVLGIDGGATKTEVAVMRLDDYDLTSATGGPSNADAVGRAAAGAALKDTIETALEQAGATASDITAAVFAVAGSVTVAVGEEVAAEGSLGGAYVVNDVVAAWAAGTLCQPGIGIISGTGSHVFGVNARHESWRVGGWGHILGDEGSAYWLGLEALKASLAYREGSGPETRLLERATKLFELKGIEDLPELFYGKPLTKAEVARFAKEVYAAAESGDGVARALFDAAGEQLANQAGAAVRALGMERERFPIALVGSTFRAGRLLQEPLERAVHRVARDAFFRLAEVPPVAGSALLAVRAAGRWERFDEAAFLTAAKRDLEVDVVTPR
jgi:glucosamine kinase